MDILGLILLTILALVDVHYLFIRMNQKKINNNKNTIDTFVAKAMVSKIASDAQKHRKDQEKYNVIDEVVKEFIKIKKDKIKIDNQEIDEILTVNGIRFTFKDGSWGLIRASSNKPSLVVVTESPTSEERKINIFKFIDEILQKTGKIGEYDQKI